MKTHWRLSFCRQCQLDQSFLQLHFSISQYFTHVRLCSNSPTVERDRQAVGNPCEITIALFSSAETLGRGLITVFGFFDIGSFVGLFSARHAGSNVFGCCRGISVKIEMWY